MGEPLPDPWKVKKPEYASTPSTPPEFQFITDDERFIAELIAHNWSLGLEEELSIGYVPEYQVAMGRTGYVYVYRISRTNDGIKDINYRTLERTCRIGIRIGNRFRDRNFMWAEEITRILLNWRRAGQKKLNGWSYLELSGDNMVANTQGWYSTTIEVKLTKKNQGIMSPGFGIPDRVEVPSARFIPHQKISMRTEDLARVETDLEFKELEPKVVSHPENGTILIRRTPERGTLTNEETGATKGITYLPTVLENGITEEHEHKLEGTVHTSERPLGEVPAWENRMFSPMPRKVPYKDNTPPKPVVDTNGDDDLY